MKRLLFIMIIALGVISCTKQKNKHNIEGVWQREGNQSALKFEDGIIYNTSDIIQGYYEVYRKELITYGQTHDDPHTFQIYILTKKEMKIYVLFDDGSSSDTISYTKI